MKNTLLRLLIPYILIRLFSYVQSPRPYLWWHAAVDCLVIVFYAGFAILLKRKKA